MTDRIDYALDGALREIPRGPRKCTPRAGRYSSLTPLELKAEAIRVQPLSGMGKRAAARAFGKPYETVKDWLDQKHRPLSCPPEDFVEWLALHADARSLVRVA